MKQEPRYQSLLLRWGKLLLLSAPLLASCSTSSNAESPSAETALVAANSAGGDKDVKKDADMKEVILHVFGMT